MDLLRNGLTRVQVQNAYTLFAKVNLSKICRESGVNVSTVYNVLHDKSSQMDQLNKVVLAAKKELKKRSRAIKKMAL